MLAFPPRSSVSCSCCACAYPFLSAQAVAAAPIRRARLPSPRTRHRSCLLGGRGAYPESCGLRHEHRRSRPQCTAQCSPLQRPTALAQGAACRRCNPRQPCHTRRTSAGWRGCPLGLGPPRCCKTQTGSCLIFVAAQRARCHLPRAAGARSPGGRSLADAGRRLLHPAASLPLLRASPAAVGWSPFDCGKRPLPGRYPGRIL